VAGPTVVHDTFVLERSYAFPVERVFAYLSDPAKKRRWYADAGSHNVDSFEMDFREGGAERSIYRLGETTPFPGVVMTNDGAFEDIVPNVRIVLATSMTFGGRRISTALITFELLGQDVETKLILTHQACFYEGADGPQMRKGGWVALLDSLGKAMAD
jgi:uncharacterized protein YndB with AHSA1/START domain